MASVGLLYVGAVLFLNGVMLLGWVDARAAAPLNLFVGLLQVVTPTYLIFTAQGDPAIVLNASGLYLFGFTYLYVAFNLLADLDSTGVGYFSAFVAVCALAYSGLNFFQVGDNAFGVIWLYWAFLWFLFFLLLGRKMEPITRYTGAVTAIQGWVTGAIPAFLLLTGQWGRADATTAIALAIFGVVVFGALWMRMRPSQLTVSPESRHTVAESHS
ncbi:AmiS/UreI family transporter [Pseudonocardia asaccharolytica]|uniref:Transporter n=1 Tax=Pseudonocardia asaccharolytica DSM 44247 = NBRC 16224 TaxID=1123024 RepID=A0A511CZ34_9PSEU|nr:AmiS/UreI family transporter [Pseudonocardia asaccharolytica]GEL16524.1 transporter [Pseudonocardia asaccharolytica DSM 44247 = NBRC 16224]